MVKPTPIMAVVIIKILLAFLEPPKKDKQYKRNAYAAAYNDTKVKVPNIFTKIRGVSGENLAAYQPIMITTGIKAATSDHKKK